MNASTVDAPECAPLAVFDHLCTAAYHALEVETLDYATWMAEAEAAWITVAGAEGWQ